MSVDTFIIEGRAYSWRALCELRKAPLEARRTAQGKQLALFELHGGGPFSRTDPAKLLT
jgi:hypothetical protein